MLKPLLLLFAMVITLVISGQNHINCKDTVTYALQKTTTTQGINVFDSSASALGQWYDAPEAVTIHGVEFFAWENSAYTSNPVPVWIKLYASGSNFLPILPALDSVEVMVSSSFGTGPFPYNRRKFGMFNTPVKIGGPYVITAEVYGPYSVAILSNDWTKPDGKGEFLNVAKISGFWYRGSSVTVGGVPFDSDVLVHPIVSYDVKADFTMDKSCIEDGDTIFLVNKSSKIAASKFYNKVAFADTSTKKYYSWQYDDGTGYHHKYQADTIIYPVKDKYVITFTDSVIGWRNQCIAVKKDSVDQQPVADFDILGLFNTKEFKNTSTGSDQVTWDLGDGAFTNLQNPVYNYVDPGEYTITLTVRNACGTDAVTKTTRVFGVGIEDNYVLADFKLYPNPATDKLTISFKNTSGGKATFGIFNSLGELILEEKAGNTVDVHQTIQLPDLPSGVYFIRISIGESSFSKAFNIFK